MLCCVAFLCAVVPKDDSVCIEFLLKGLLVSPTHFSCLLLFCLVTVAWCIIYRVSPPETGFYFVKFGISFMLRPHLLAYFNCVSIENFGQFVF